jgi:hypothetical protein
MCTGATKLVPKKSFWQQKSICLPPTTPQKRDIISSIDNGRSHHWIATTNLLGLHYLDTVAQSIQNILRCRKAYSIKVTDVNFEDKSPPESEGLPVFDAVSSLLRNHIWSFIKHFMHLLSDILLRAKENMYIEKYA